jgi:lipopolysaccharide/colanic/teichoic acid biosynthesis glycosyltransferase
MKDKAKLAVGSAALDKEARKREFVLTKLLNLQKELPANYSRWIPLAIKFNQNGVLNERLVEFYQLMLPLYVQYSRHKRYIKLKTVFDALWILGSLPVVLPLIGLIALWIKFESPGPVFFRQLRVGRLGNPFWIYKFRTMFEGAETSHPTGRPLFKIDDDKRITRSGLFLRRNKLDELPQIFNVLRGEMSLIGPRPLSVSDSLSMSSRFLTRLAVKPGMSGLWQALRPLINNSNAKLAMDVLYVKKIGIALDIKLFFHTFRSLWIGERPHRYHKQKKIRPTENTDNSRVIPFRDTKSSK